MRDFSFADGFGRLTRNIEGFVHGNSEEIRLALICLFAEGHLLIEGVPGVAKTSLAKAIARSIAADQKRIQFTPDLLPSDVTGGRVFQQDTGTFRFEPGPVFTNILLADEINRSSPRTQSALLEVMAERQVTVDGTTYGVGQPFLCVATQNPVEHRGTFPLPEAQIDRFMMKVTMKPPARPGGPATSSTASAAGSSMPANPTFTLQDPGGKGVYGVVFLSNSTLATGDLVGSSYLWNVADAKHTATLSDQSGQGIFGLSYDPHGDLLAANTFNAPSFTTGSTVLWQASTHTYLTTLTDPSTEGVGNPVAFSPDGGTLAAADANGSIYLWNTVTHQNTGTLADPGSQRDFGLAFSQRTGLLAAADGSGTTYLWDTRRARIVASFPDPSSEGVRSVAFSQDGGILATGDNNGNVYLWNPTSSALITTLHGLKGATVRSIAFNPHKPVFAATLDADSSKTFEFCVWNTGGTLLDRRTNPG